jgi:assimilatory nitrate reductase catalytic subunit
MTVRTTCPYCGVGCGVTADRDGAIAGDTVHPANFGALCSKGSALAETLGTRDRLLAPTVRGREASWEEATSLIAAQFSQAVAEQGPDSVALYVSGQFLTEDYYVANKWMKGFVGTANIDTNSRLCMASAVAAHVRAFGEDVVPGCYEDVDEADLAVLVGSNMAWCHPVLHRRLMAAREKRGTKIVVIDPRRTATCEGADLHLLLEPGTDVLLFDGLLVHLADHDGLDRPRINAHTSGFDQALAAARLSAPSIEHVAAGCDLPADDVRRFYDLFLHTERALTLASQGVNQSVSGTDKFNAIINCHLATGRVGRPGAGPFSLTGQPNAMGGREVGGLANQLAAHMGFSKTDVDRVGRFWNALRMATRPGLKAVEMFEAVNAGSIRAIWIMATNPADSMPNAELVRSALKKCPFVVVSDCWPTDTTDLAHVVLPAAAWGEKDGTVTNSERRISRQRAFRAPPAQARADWRIICDVAARMGFGNAFEFDTAADIFREHARLSSFENDGSRRFELSAFSDITNQEYDDIAPFQWGGQRLFGDGRFSHADSRARFVTTRSVSPAQAGEKFPLRLNTGRIRDQWHTMTRTGRVPRLVRHQSEPMLDIHPSAAVTRGIADGALVRVSSSLSSTVLRARVSADQRRTDVFAPMHWSDRFCSSGPADRLVHALVDPVSGQPDLKGTAVDVQVVESFWHGVLVTPPDAAPAMIANAHWARIPLEACQAFELTGTAPLIIAAFATDAIKSAMGVEADLVTYADPGRQCFRFAAILEGKLAACLFLGATMNSIPSRDELSGLMGTPCDRQQALVLLARTRPVAPPVGNILCACFGVSAESVRESIARHPSSSVADIGRRLRAGTNCGSCIPELKALLARCEPEAADRMKTTTA